MNIRPYKETDKDFLISLSTRFAESNLMGWRDPQKWGKCSSALI